MNKPCVLIVEDDLDWLDAYHQNLQDEKYELAEANSVAQALAKMEEREYAVVLTDLKLLGAGSEYGGFEILKEASQISPSTQVIIMTAFGSREFAIKAMQQGALDYVTKPIDYEKLRFAVSNAINIHQELVKVKNNRREQNNLTEISRKQSTQQISIIGNSRSMQLVHKRIAEAAASHTTCLIYGERGTGKELIARAIHANSSSANQTFTQISCLDFLWMQRRVFIHQLRARNGTVFLKNVDQVDITTIDALTEFLRRCKLLNIRLIISSQLGRDGLQERFISLDSKLELGDILDSSSTIIWVPSLQMRHDSDDISSLVGHCLWTINNESNQTIQIEEAALEILNQADFKKGNVKELFDIVQAAADKVKELGQEIIEKKQISDLLKFHSETTNYSKIIKVFVSYSSSDREFVKSFVKDLRSTEFGSEFLDFWIDQERIPVGSEFWDKEVEKGLDASTVMLLIVSKKSMESKEVGREWHYFLKKERPILILVYEEAPIPFRLQPIQRLIYSSVNASVSVKQVIQAIMKL